MVDGIMLMGLDAQEVENSLDALARHMHAQAWKVSPKKD